MGGIKESLHDNEASNLPPEAFFGTVDWLDIDNFWLSGAELDEQLTAMRVWFDCRYFDGHAAMKAGLHPAAVYGISSPCDPETVLWSRFRGYAPDQAIAEVVADFLEVGGRGWGLKPEPYYHMYDEDFSISVDRQGEPLERLHERISEIKELQGLTGSMKAQALAQRLAYSAAITALESFLWETMIYWVESEDEVVRKIITTHPAFKDQKIELGTIFDKMESLKTDILGHMQNMVWHNWTHVAPLFKYGLDLQVSFREFDDAVKKRHDVVHRSGHTKEGEKVLIDPAEIHDLCAQIATFAKKFSNQAQEAYRKDDDELPF
jgi:hypothetical protein